MLIKLGKILMNIKKDFFKKQSGFTLVELIVVLVILAILAAFTIPAMLGFVEDARSKKSITMTREVYTAAQSASAEIYAQLGNVNVSGNSNPNITLIKEKVGTKIKEMTAGDLDFKWVVTGEGSDTAANRKQDFIEVALRYKEGSTYNPSEFKYPNSAKVWFDRSSGDSANYVVKAVWYVDKSGNYRTIILEDSEKGISTTVEKIK